MVSLRYLPNNHCTPEMKRQLQICVYIGGGGGMMGASSKAMEAQMKLEVGKFYRTRDGQKASVIKYNFGWKYEFCGLIGGARETWTSDGRAWRDGETLNDLIAEWVDEPVVEPAAADHQPVMLFPAPNGGWVVHGNEGDVIGAYTTAAEMIAALSAALGVTK